MDSEATIVSCKLLPMVESICRVVALKEIVTKKNSAITKVVTDTLCNPRMTMFGSTDLCQTSTESAKADVLLERRIAGECM